VSGKEYDEGRLSWKATGSASITSVSLAADIIPPKVDGIHAAWSGYVQFLCIEHSSSVYCLNYVISDQVHLVIEEYQYVGAVGYVTCTVPSVPTSNIWSRVELVASVDAVPTVSINGTVISTTTDPGFKLLSSTNVTVRIGLEQTADDEAWPMYFDNVVVSVRR
jgi:hypothetical protein